jgi:hypothetical protein
MGMISRVADEVNKGHSVTKRRIAKGTAPEEGEDGRLQLLVKQFDEERQKEQSSGSANLRETDHFDNIASGQIIGRIHHPIEGKDGIDALGKPIRAARVQKAKVVCDKTITRQDSKIGNFEELTSEINGYLSQEAGKLKIIGVLNVSEDVDFKTGNIDFIGDIVVGGSIMKDFRVVSQGNIQIAGNVESGFVRAPCGNIEVGGVIVGSFATLDSNPSGALDSEKVSRLATTQKPTVMAKTGLKAHTIRGAQIEVDGDLEVVKEIMGSSLKIKGALRIPDGQLLGGATFATRGVDAGVIGTSAGSRTTIVLCSEFETSAHYSSLLQSISSHKEAVELLKLQLGPIIESPEKIKSLDAVQAKKIATMYQKFQQVQESLDGLIAARNDMQKEMARSREVRVNVRRVMFPGVEIIADGKKFVIEKEIKGDKSITFNSETKTFSIGKLRPLDAQTTPEERAEEETVLTTPKSPSEQGTSNTENAVDN